MQYAVNGVQIIACIIGIRKPIPDLSRVSCRDTSAHLVLDTIDMKSHNSRINSVKSFGMSGVTPVKSKKSSQVVNTILIFSRVQHTKNWEMVWVILVISIEANTHEYFSPQRQTLTNYTDVRYHYHIHRLSRLVQQKREI